MALPSIPRVSLQDIPGDPWLNSSLGRLATVSRLGSKTWRYEPTTSINKCGTDTQVGTPGDGEPREGPRTQPRREPLCVLDDGKRAMGCAN